MTATEPSQVDDATTAPGPSETAAYRDVERKRAIRYHRRILLMSVAMLALSFSLETTSDRRAKAPLFGRSLPTICFVKQSTGFDCPGCGMTRCFIAMAHGRLEEAFHYHPVGMAMVGLLVAQLPYRGLQLWRLARGRKQLEHRALVVLPWVLMIGMLIQWVLKTAGLVHY